MFFLLAVLSMLGYSAQQALMVKWYRQIDGLTAISLRGISLGVTMLPLLLLSSPQAVTGMIDHGGMLILAAVVTAFANWAAAVSYRYLAVGIATAFQYGILVVFIALVGYFFFDEDLSTQQYLYIAFIVLGSALLNIKRENGKVEKDTKALIGFSLCMVFSVLITLATFLVVKLSRDVDPYLTAYSWEFSIGIVSVFLVYFRSRCSSHKVSKISWSDFISLSLCAAPTAIGTGLYAVAVTGCPIAVVGAVLSSGVATMTILGFLMYNEKLSFSQCLTLLLIVVSIIGLKLAG